MKIKVVLIIMIILGSTTLVLSYENHLPSKSERFAELLYVSSLDKEVKRFILNNLDNYTREAQEEWYRYLLGKTRKNSSETEKYKGW